MHCSAPLSKITLLIGLISSLLTGGCSKEEPSNQRSLTIATSADNPPFEFHKMTDGKDEVVGFDIELAHIITKKLGYTLVIQDMDFNGLVAALQSGRVDAIMAGLSITKERSHNVDFSIPYHENKHVLVFKTSTSSSSAQDLSGKTLGVQLGSTLENHAKALQKEHSNISIAARTRLGELIQELKIGRIDTLLFEKRVAKSFIAQNSDLAMSSIAGGDSQLGIAFAKGSALRTEFDKVLTDMKRTGELEKLRQKWFSTNS